jgi:hypothetical protein
MRRTRRDKKAESGKRAKRADALKAKIIKQNQGRRINMKKVCVLAMVLCLAFAASVYAADIPGQKLTDAEASCVRGMGFILPVSLLGSKVIVNGVSSAMTVTPTSTGYSLSFTSPNVSANATFTK